MLRAKIRKNNKDPLITSLIYNLKGSNHICMLAQYIEGSRHNIMLCIIFSINQLETKIKN